MEDKQAKSTTDPSLLSVMHSTKDPPQARFMLDLSTTSVLPNYIFKHLRPPMQHPGGLILCTAHQAKYMELCAEKHGGQQTAPTVWGSPV